MTDMIDIRGSGGGGKGGGGSARTPVESRDSLHNTSYAVILDAIANGEVYGPAGGSLLRSVYLNGTPIQNANGGLNFNNVIAHWRPGNQAQDHIPGFPSSSNIVSVGTELQYGQPWVQRLTNPSLDAVRVSIHTPQLVKTIDSGNKAGDRVGNRVNYAIDLSTDNGAFVTVVNSSFNGKTVNGYTRTHRIELPAGTEWTIRVRRLTPDSTNSLIADKTIVQSYAEVVDGKFRYPMTSLVGIKIDAEQFSQVPTRAYHWKGSIIRVPSNYNPDTRTYSGAWDGSFKRAYSNNPAWVYYDILTSPLYGLGENVTASMIDRYALYQIAVYCDQLVSDGQGGREPRFTCNTYIQSKADALRVLNDLTSVFRGISYYANNQVIAVADRPSDPVYTFSNAKVVNGLFEYTGSDLSTIKTVALVSYNDPDDFYRAKVEVVNDDDGIRRYGIRKTELVAFGCTSRGQAQRVGLYHLYTSRMETGGVSFSVGLDGFIPQPGDLVRIADNDLAGRQIGGMLKSATRTVLTLDRDVAAKVGDKISVNIAGKTEQRTISSISGRNIIVSQAFSRAPKTSAYAIDATDLVSRIVRVISIKENDDLTFTISAVLHHPNKFDAIDHNVRLEPLPVSVVPARSQNAPTNIVIRDYSTIKQGISNTNLEITWDKTQGAVKYDLQYKRDNSDWIQLPATGQTTVTLENVYTGEYVARVRAINALDVPSLWAYSSSTEVAGLLANPQPLVGLTTQSQIYGILVSWVYPTGPNIIDRIELMRSNSNNFSAAILHGEYSYPTNSTTVPAKGAEVMYFWARTVDKNGLKSAWYPTGSGVRGEASSDVDEYTEVFKDEFLDSTVGQQMMADIGDITTDVGLINLEIEGIDGKITTINDVVAEAQSNIDGAFSSIESINTDVFNINSDISNVNLELIDVNALVSNNTTAIGNAQSDIGNLFGSIGTLDDLIDDLGIGIGEQDARIDALQAELSDLIGSPDWDANESYLAGQIVKFDTGLYRARQNVPAGTPVSDTNFWEKIGNYESIGEAVASLLARMSTSEAYIDDISGEVIAQSQEMLAMQSDLTSLDADVSGQATAIDNLETNVTEIDGKVTAQAQAHNTLKAEFDNQEIGGRNLLRNTGYPETILVVGHHSHVETYDHEMGEFGRKLYTSGSFAGFYTNLLSELVAGKTYTLSFYSSSDVFTELDHIAIRSGSKTGVSLPVVAIDSDDNKKRSVTFTSPISETGIGAYIRVTGENAAANPGGWFTVSQIQLEEGNVATAWSPNPDDFSEALDGISADITATNTVVANNKQAATQALNTHVSEYNSNKSSVQGQITTLSNEQSSTAQTVNSLTARVDGIDDDIGGIEADMSSMNTVIADNKQAATQALDSHISVFNANKSSVDSQLVTLSNDQSSQAQAHNTLKAEFDNQEIGGRNLLRNTGYPETILVVGHHSHVETYDHEMGEFGRKLYTSGSFAGFYTNLLSELVAGKTYTLSFYSSSDVFTELDHIAIRSGSKTGVSLPVVAIDSDDNKKRSVTFTSPISETGIGAYIRVTGENAAANPGGWFTVSQIQLEEGNVATAWSPNPDDFSEALDGISADITATNTVVANNKQAATQALNTHISDYNSNRSAVQGQITTLTNDQSSTATQLNTVQATANNAQASAQTANTAVSDINGRLSSTITNKVQILSNGQRVQAGTGLGIESDPNGTGFQSSFNVWADRFSVWSGAGTTLTTPFTVSNGQVFMSNALIKELTSENVKTRSLKATDLEAGTITAASGVMGHLAVTTLNIANNAVTIGGSRNLTANNKSESYWKEIVQLTLNVAQQANVDIQGSFTVRLRPASQGPTEYRIGVRYLRNGVVIGGPYSYDIDTTGRVFGELFDYHGLSFPSAFDTISGAATFSIQVRVEAGTLANVWTRDNHIRVLAFMK